MTLSSPPADDTLRQLLTTARTIAVVGHSNKLDRPSYQIAKYLRRVGYRVYPVNPAIATIDGEPCYPSLLEVPEPIDIVNVFRRSEYLPATVDEATDAGAKSVWAQLRVKHPDAVVKAEAAGILLVMDLCIKIEHRRLSIPSTLQ
ncbi:MAG: CoA-binding protein [Cyanobacteria bacterium Co-bin8]|nr:CoA-binding protein [Cyanobacteria bacterium Co-bin8]